jgi:DNA-binding SARP family transcriptional activator
VNQSLSFHVLGPLSVLAENRPLAIPGGKQRILLATLLLKFNQVVPVDELVERLWDAELPHQPRRALHTCLTRLRHAITGKGREDVALIHTSHAGYMIEVSPDNLDLARFSSLLATARHAAGGSDLSRESRALTEALALWRGHVLPDVPSDSLHRDVIPKLTEEWMRTLERHGELGLALGRHHELVGDLRVLTFKYPFHERFWQQLILALYRCGRRVEALMAFAEVTTRIRDELGVEPSPELRALHLAILRDDVPTVDDRSAARPVMSIP